MRGLCLVFTSLFFVLIIASCTGKDSAGNAPEDTKRTSDASAKTEAERTVRETTAMEETTIEQGLTPAKAKVGPKEITNMTPADGKQPDPARPAPENPPRDVKTYPATTNRSVEGKIEYEQRPPTNGDHAPIWQNCGFYSKPIDDRTAVHSMDHGVVWISYRPNLSADQIQTLRGYGDENYVIVSPYPGLPTPVVVTAWRNQLKLKSADDPRLRQFVSQFRISEIAPLSGNRCIGGVGDPE
jgi:hypothetical protein